MKKTSSHTSKYKLVLLTLGSFSSILFLLWTILVRADILHQFDFDLTVRLQDNLSTHLRLTDLFCSLSLFGNIEIMIGLLATLLLLRRKFVGAVLTAGLFGIAHIIEIIGKILLDHPNPPQFFIKCYNFFPSTYIQPGYSYPSGHSLRVVFLGIILYFMIYKTPKLNPIIKLCGYAAIMVVAVTMLISRVSLGEHWPTDVVGGMLLGVAFSLFSLLFL